MFVWYIDEVKKSKFYNNQPIVIHKGSLKPKYLFIGEAPCRKSVETKKPFSGISGMVLDRWINYLGYDNCGVINVVPLVMTNKNKLISPSKDIMISFIPSTLKLIKLLSSNINILLGLSVKNILEDKVKNNIFIKHPAWYFRKGKINYIPNEIKKLKENKIWW